MNALLANFVHALRNAGVRASPAETLDACAAVERLGWSDRGLLKAAWSAALAKTSDEQAAFDVCFERFFTPPSVLGTVEAPPRRPLDAGQGTGGFGGGGGSVAAAGSADGLGSLGDAVARADEDGLAHWLLADDRAALAAAMDRAATAVDLARMSMFTQRGLYLRRMLDAMGVSELERELAARDDEQAAGIAARLDALRAATKDHVWRRFELHGDASGERLRERALRRVRLDALEHATYRDLQPIVQKMARRLARRLRRRQRARRGALDMRGTLAANAGLDGLLFELRWKRRAPRRAQLIVACDVSGSMRSAARFFLLFLHSLADALPKIRAFVFSDGISEVSECFARYPVEQAVERALLEQGGGGTDYAVALEFLHARCATDMDRRTTLIMLGDSRNNHKPPRQDLLAGLYRRCGQLWWLNPEARRSWHSGDANMRHYAPYCHHLSSCGTLDALERALDDILVAAHV